MGLQTAMSSTAPVSLPGDHLQSLLASASSASASSKAAGELCGRLPGLVLQQLDVCRRNPLAMPCVGLGARLGLVECQYQFQYERWNCSPVGEAAAAAASAAANDEVAEPINATSSVDTFIERGILPIAYVCIKRPPTPVNYTALLSELHWLPVQSRITFKIACLTL